MTVLLLILIVVGTLPLWVGLGQFLLVGLHGVRNHLDRCADTSPRTAFIIPAWNEAPSLTATINALMRQDYPEGAIRIYVVDDASTDNTGEVLAEMAARFPGAIFHLRRERGGQGKAHTLNHGLDVVLAEPWAEAVMIMDADVLFERSALRRMARHLADPEVGAVTAYIKEGSRPAGHVNRFIAFEYITAQAAARRAQNVMGALACMAGGAQLHSRANLERLGGRIDTGTLAEDTFTTMLTQVQGRRALFEGNAVVWAEEPADLDSLWKQRLRWARGNLQLTWAFRHMWFRPWKNRRLGSVLFGLQWFAILLVPVFILLTSIGLVGLVTLGSHWALALLSLLWGLAVSVYLFQTTYALMIDPNTAKRTWLQGMLYPGAISLTVMFMFAVQSLTHGGPEAAVAQWNSSLLMAVSAWPALSMPLARTVLWAERMGAPVWLRNLLLSIVGYGPLMASVSLAAMFAQMRGVEVRWDKTVKLGRARMIDGV